MDPIVINQEKISITLFLILNLLTVLYYIKLYKLKKKFSKYFKIMFKIFILLQLCILFKLENRSITWVICYDLPLFLGGCV